MVTPTGAEHKKIRDDVYDAVPVKGLGAAALIAWASQGTQE
jgi:hypothetical protein